MLSLSGGGPGPDRDRGSCQRLGLPEPQPVRSRPGGGVRRYIRHTVIRSGPDPPDS
jgi:hypothetical protein